MIVFDCVILWFQLVHGEWGIWNSWGACSVTCGYVNGTKERSRDCNSPAPRNGGDDCVGNSTDALVCDADPCTSKSTKLLFHRSFPHQFN